MLIDKAAFLSLRAIMTRLYDDRPLTGDERRDLANKMFAVLDGAIPITGETP